MPAILKLDSETLLQILDNVHPDDIVNLSRSCQTLKLLAQDTLAQHVARLKMYTKITLYGCHRHQDDPHPINLFAEICKDPKIAYYPRSLNIGCCERFAMHSLLHRVESHVESHARVGRLKDMIVVESKCESE